MLENCRTLGPLLICGASKRCAEAKHKIIRARARVCAVAGMLLCDDDTAHICLMETPLKCPASRARVFMESN